MTVVAELAKSFGHGGSSIGRAEIPKALAASATTQTNTYFSLTSIPFGFTVTVATG